MAPVIFFFVGTRALSLRRAAAIWANVTRPRGPRGLRAFRAARRLAERIRGRLAALVTRRRARAARRLAERTRFIRPGSTMRLSRALAARRSGELNVRPLINLLFKSSLSVGRPGHGSLYLSRHSLTCASDRPRYPAGTAWSRNASVSGSPPLRETQALRLFRKQWWS